MLGHMIMSTAHAIVKQGQIAQQEGGEPAHAAEQEGASSRLLGEKRQPAATSIHTVCPSNGSPYQNYQMRIAYATYKLTLGMPGGERHTGFTRVLHRGSPDELMDEVPTFRANPLQPACDNWCEYPVSDRANAVRQFLEAAQRDSSLIKGEWLYVIESDYVFMKPLELPTPTDLQTDGWGFFFDYIQPTAHPESMRKLYPESAGPIGDVPRTGPAPVLLRRAVWEKLVPEWERLTAVIEADEGMKEELGWVREMHAFSAAVALLRLALSLSHAPAGPFITELPKDSALGAAHAFHYTLCTIYLDPATEQRVWQFDKRFYAHPDNVTQLQPILPPPSFQEGRFKFIEGPPVRAGVHAAIEQMVAQMNRGIATLQPLVPAS